MIWSHFTWKCLSIQSGNTIEFSSRLLDGKQIKCTHNSSSTVRSTRTDPPGESPIDLKAFLDNRMCLGGNCDENAMFMIESTLNWIETYADLISDNQLTAPDEANEYAHYIDHFN